MNTDLTCMSIPGLLFPFTSISLATGIYSFYLSNVKVARSVSTVTELASAFLPNSPELLIFSAAIGLAL